ncbi:MAG: hypothetical protein ACJ8M4_10515, partial [Chthoniobacterales bacterium]
EAEYVRVVEVDIAGLISELNKLNEWNGVIYVADTSAKVVDNSGTVTNPGTAAAPTPSFGGSTVPDHFNRAIRFKNGATLPTGGMTIVSENPVYILGDFNTGGSPPSNSGTYTDPDVSGYVRRNAAIVADAVTVLSGDWNDSNSNKSTPQRDAKNTTVNAAIVAGIVPTTASAYSGGGENFVRLLEDWSGAHFTYYGSMVQLYKSQQARGVWITPGGTVYKSPTRHWFYEPNFSTSSPPGNLQIAAYLQQQRWYQVY